MVDGDSISLHSAPANRRSMAVMNGCSPRTKGHYDGRLGIEIHKEDVVIELFATRVQSMKKAAR